MDQVCRHNHRGDSDHNPSIIHSHHQVALIGGGKHSHRPKPGYHFRGVGEPGFLLVLLLSQDTVQGLQRVIERLPRMHRHHVQLVFPSPVWFSFFAFLGHNWTKTGVLVF